MGRRLLIPSEAPPHPFLAALLLLAWAAASMAVMLSLCATCLRKAGSSKPPSPSPSSLSEDSTAKLDKETDGGSVVAQSLAMAELEGEKFAEAAAGMTVIELAPDVATHGPIGPTVLLPTPSTKRKLSMSLSKGLPDKLRASRRERKAEWDSEDSIWKKTIILGEKCKVAGEEEEEEEVSVVDDKGNRQRCYHQRTWQTSRNSSFAYTDRDDRETSGRTGAGALSGHE